MNVYLRIGNNRTFALNQAVLLYQDGSRAFATLHEVKHRGHETPYLCAGQSVTTGFLETLAKGLGARMGAEVLPEYVLARTPELVAWWSRAQRRVLFFGEENAEAKHLNGKMYPHPGLVFMIHGRELFVRALGGDCRPRATTRLKNAPYWNTDANGRVCLGSMRVPGETKVGSLSGWENAYFASEFTHPSGAVRLTSHPRGFLGLWSSLAAGKRNFPVKFLADSKQTLQEFLERRGEG
ncbi:MAG: PRTRC system protein B [Acidobacteriia bacterium]|nr:PRTRC system protein B [Terriglobia bacterium]